MGDKAREYKRSTLRRLDTLSGNQCASPTCENSLVAIDGITLISQICHIEAASEKGPRFNPDMDDDDRRHYNNLVLLCSECHNIIDNKENEARFPVALLKEWKITHEAKQLDKLKNNISFLKNAISAIADANFDDYEDNTSSDSTVFKIESKITYNNIVRNRYLIDEYKVYYTKIASIYSELEIQGSFKKDNLLRNIRKIYLKTKGKYVLDSKDVIEATRMNADNIIEEIEDQLLASCEAYSGIPREDVSFGISVVMVDAFMRCKILEVPEE